MNSNAYPNEAIRLLRVKHAKIRAVARAADVQPSAALRWFVGSSRPEPDRRRMLAQAFGVDVGAWDRPANKKLRNSSKPKAAPVPDAAPSILTPDTVGTFVDVPPVDFEEPGAPLALATAALRRAQSDTARVRSAAGTTEAEIRAAEMAELRATVNFARRLGDFNQTEEQRLVRSAAWQSIRARTLKALEAFPSARAAVVAALEREGA